MRIISQISLILLILISCVAQNQNAAIPPSCAQLILVRSSDWDTLQGTLETFEKGPDQSWNRIHGPFAVVLGKNGMGWGHGLHPKVRIEGPEKMEGDGKSPAGVFRLGFAFGYDTAPILGGLTFDYRQMSPSMLCIDDVHSRFYNQIIDVQTMTSSDWETFEWMRRVDDLYHYGIVIEHNPENIFEKGSCIFLHIWRDSQHGTAGCTAMPVDRMEALLLWLSKKKDPLLVQLPEHVYTELRYSWALP